MKTVTPQKGFTLIELLVVVAIISLLSSIVFASLNSARAKARDSKAKQDFHQITNALYLYYNANGRMPYNYWCSPGVWCDKTGNWGACDMGASAASYNSAMQEMVTAGYLPAIPHNANGFGYCYYNYGAGSVGGLVWTRLEAAANSVSAAAAYGTGGAGNVCRPFSGNVCNYDSADTFYCTCNSQ